MTPQQQLNAFLNHCTTIRQDYFYSFKKRSSSLRHPIARLENQINTAAVKPLLEEDYTAIVRQLQVSSPKDHVKYLPALQSLVAVWGSNRNYVALGAGLMQPVTTLYWNYVTEALSTTPGRIGISSRYGGYHQSVARHLTALKETTAADTMLNAIHTGAQNVIIVDHPLTNQCGANGSMHGMNLVARELFDANVTTLGAQTQAALNRAAVGAKTRPLWLADKINETPRYKLKGLPATAACNLGVTEAQVTQWLGGRSIWQDFGNEDDLAQIKNGVIVALYSVSTAGNGCASTVNYTLGTTNPLNAERPPAIGLAHELVHAYYSMQGLQPGFEVENATTVLFEYRCVGLGPWDGEPVSENAIRADWDDTLLAFDPEDDRNLKHVGARQFYSPA